MYAVLNPALPGIGPEQPVQPLVRHDVELLFLGILPDIGIVRESCKACRGEDIQ